MDPLTQGVLGAGLAVAAARRGEVRAAAVTGFVAGVLPDIDTLIRSADDPLLVLEFHRHFTHALVFIPVGALAAALLLWPLLRRRLHFARLYLYALLGYATAGLLDACTSYGTHLLWPFVEQPVAWSIIAIVDPVFSLLLAVPLAFAVLARRPVLARVSLLLAGAYLLAGFVQHQRALDSAEAMALLRGHVPVHLLVKPTLGNLLLWRSLYVAGGQLHADGIRIGWTGDVRIYEGESAPLFTLDEALDWAPAGSAAARDLARFARLSGNLLVRDPRDPRRVGDARYAMLPTSLEPLWMVAPGAGEAGAGADFVTARDFDASRRDRFLAMLRGKAP